MTPAARHGAAIAVLDAWRDGLAVEQALARWARGARYAGSKDRAAVRDIVYDGLRRMGRASRAGGGDTGRAVVLGLLRLDGQDPASIFTGEGYAPERLGPDEAVVPENPAGPEADIPAWLRDAVARRASDPSTPGDLFDALCQRAPVWLRVASRHGGPDDAIASLGKDGIEARPDPRCVTALEVTSGARRIRQSRAYREGLIELQDLSAQRAVACVAWPDRGRVLDYCAGGGGKALAIADRTGAQVLAHDVSARRMSDLPARAARAGVSIPLLDQDGVRSGAPYDAVLCDVPCSGSGTWRRDPEAKWRLSPESLQMLCREQQTILESVAGLVRPGGCLVYMTCSLLEAENEEQVAAFEARHGGWTREVVACDTPLTASDGFFTAVWRREPT